MNSVSLSPARHALLGAAIAIAASATTSAEPVGSIDDFFQPGGVTATKLTIVTRRIVFSSRCPFVASSWPPSLAGVT